MDSRNGGLASIYAKTLVNIIGILVYKRILISFVRVYIHAVEYIYPYSRIVPNRGTVT